MSTKPKRDALSIALDARHVLDAAKADLKSTPFKKRIPKAYLAAFAHNIADLEAGDGARGPSLITQVQAGVHVAQARAALWSFVTDVRDDAKLFYPSDLPLQHAFGVGAIVSAASTSQVLHLAGEMVAAAKGNKTQASKIGLDGPGLHHLAELVDAVNGTDLAHVHAATGRHSNTVHTDSLAHIVSSSTAHVRLAAKRAFKGDAARLARYDSTLPRHTVETRKKTAPSGGSSTHGPTAGGSASSPASTAPTAAAETLERRSKKRRARR